MGYWKTKVLPKIRRILYKASTRKTAAIEVCKEFEDGSGIINNEFEEKKVELIPRVIEIYEAASIEAKTVVKERKEAGIKKNSTAVHKFLKELVKIDFPGSKVVSDYCSKYGPEMVSGPVAFILEKVFVIVTDEANKAEAAIKAAIKEEKEMEKVAEVETREEPARMEEKEAEVEREEEPPKMEVETQEIREEIEAESSEIVMEPMEPSMIDGEAEAVAAPKA